MARLGSKQRPVMVRVQGERTLDYVERTCREHGLEFIAELVQDGALEDLSDLEQALDPSKRVSSEPARREHHVGRNGPCPCGSGAKFKKCCAGKPTSPA